MVIVMKEVSKTYDNRWAHFEICRQEVTLRVHECTLLDQCILFSQVNFFVSGFGPQFISFSSYCVICSDLFLWRTGRNFYGSR